MDMRTKVVLQDCAGVEDHVQEGRKERLEKVCKNRKLLVELFYV